MNTSPLTIHIPLRLRRHGGRKLVIVPDGSSEPAQRRPDDALVKALARAWRWKRMIESGKVRSLNDIAETEKLNSSYVSRIFRLTLLAPDIVEAILDGRQPRTLQLADLMDDMPVEWERQRERFCRRRILEGAASVDPWSGGAGCKCLVHSAAASG